MMDGRPPATLQTSHVDDDDDDDETVYAEEGFQDQTVEMESLNYDGNPTTKCHVPIRVNIGAMVFVALAISVMMRSNPSMTLLAMVQPIQNGTAVPMPDYGPRYSWTPLQQSSLLGAFFYGSTASIVPIGMLIDKYGCVRRFVFVATFISAVLDFATPLAAACSFTAIFMVRFLIGVLHGCLFPAAYKLFSNWAPPNELGKFTWSLMGSNIGGVLTWSLTGYVIEALGWHYSHYISGSAALLFTMAWLFYVYDSPADHPKIEARERIYIEKSLRHSAKNCKTWPPIRSFITSIPVLSLFVLSFGNLWSVFMFVTAAPKFIHEVLGFQLGCTGLLASIPNVLRCLVSLMIAMLGDSIRSSKRWEVLTIRRVFCVVSHIMPGLLLIALPYAIFNPYLCIVVMAVSFGLNGAVAQSVYVNYHDLTPNFAASLISLCNGVGSVSGFVSPLIVTYFTASERNSIDGWQQVFLCAAIIYIAPALVFICFGSASVQPWNNTAAKEEFSVRTVRDIRSKVNLNNNECKT